MSLGLAILTDEGVVLSAESLGTLIGQEQKELKAICSNCGKETVPNMICSKCNKDLGPTPKLTRSFPVSHTYYCQKLFKINGHSGVIVVGNPSLGKTKAQYAVFSFINWLKEHDAFDAYALEIAEKWQEFCEESKILDNHRGNTSLLFAGTREEKKPSSFGVNISITDGKLNKGRISTHGVMAAGVHDILDKIFEGGGIQKYPVKEFPLQDAVEFAEFLIMTQIGIDKYSARIPRVGGDIDIAVIHPIHGFKKKKKKNLHKKLEI